jgi:MFS family permease
LTTSSDSPGAGSYRKYLLAVLLLILTFEKIDIAAIGVLLQSIKASLALSDTQLGFLTGLAFTLFYSTMGIPLARWADRGNRVVILSLATGLHCIAVALCGVTRSYTQLLLVRVGVAVGEAGGIPPANSLIADHFLRAERARATAAYLLGYPLSSIAGYFLAGWINEFYGWRTTFVVLGAPGIFLAVTAWCSLRDPRAPAQTDSHASSSRAFQSRAPVVSPRPPSLSAASKTLAFHRTFRHILAGYTLVTFFGIGIWLWAPTFFIRSFQMKTGEVGTWFAILWGVGGLLGTYLGGELASRYATDNEALQLKAMAVTFALFGVISAGIFLSHDRWLAFSLLGITAVANFAIYGPLFAIVQTLIDDRLRATAVATIYLFANLFGIGLGSIAVGTLSDSLRPLLGSDSLRYALLILCPGYAFAAWEFFRAASTVTADLASPHALHLSRSSGDRSL